jgi:hypothetical protein
MIHPSNRAERMALKVKKSEAKVKPSGKVRRIKEYIKAKEAQNELQRARTEDVGSLVRQL